MINQLFVSFVSFSYFLFISISCLFTNSPPSGHFKSKPKSNFITFSIYSTHIAAIKSTGNVFSYEAIEELNIKPKSFRDLLTDEPYKRQDILTLQDPQDHSKFNLNAFHHIKNSLKLEDDDLERAKTDPKARLKRMNLETKEALAELEKTYKPTEMDVKPENKKDKVTYLIFILNARCRFKI